MTLPILIQYLIVVLLLVGIVALIRLWSVLGSARVTLEGLEATRLEAAETLQRMDATLKTTDQLLREEVAPTLQAARATLGNVEMATRALAETTGALRRLTGKAENVSDTGRLISAGTALVQRASQRNGKPSNTGNLLSGIALGVGVRLANLLARRRKKT